MYCFDTDVLSAVLRRDPPLALVRKLAATPAHDQFTTAITFSELLYGALRTNRQELAEAIRRLIDELVEVLPFDERAADVHASLRADLEAEGKPLHEADLRIASIARSRGLILVTGNVRHFSRIPGLVIENWLDGIPGA